MARPPTSFELQSLNAEELELRVYAQILELEKQGIVRIIPPDGVEILNQQKYFKAMGMTSPRTTP